MKIVRLPDAGREEMLEAAGLPSSSHWSELDTPSAPPEEHDFLTDGGWIMVSTHNAGDVGAGAHRGILSPEEYVDDNEFIVAVEREMGFTYDDIRSVYKQGRKTDAQRELRGRIDARLLALSRSGGNILELGRRLGFRIDAGDSQGGDSCRTLERALARAREVEGTQA